MIQNHKLPILLGITAIGGLCLYYYYTHKPSSHQLIQPSPPTLQKTFQQQYKDVIQAVKVHFDGINFNQQSIKAICKAQYHLATQDYQRQIFIMRDKRRSKFNDKEEYAKIILATQSQLQQILNKHLSAILANFNIPRQTWMIKINQWIQIANENNQKWSSIISEVEDEILDSLRVDDKFYTFQQLKNIYSYKLQTIKHLNADKLTIHMTNEQNGKFALIENYVCDSIFKKYGVEEEYLNYSIKYLKQSQKNVIADIIDQYNEQMQGLMFPFE